MTPAWGARPGVLHNLGWLTGAQVVAQLLNVAALVYLARLLGAHWFGVVQVGVALSGYALLAAEWGLMSLGIREVARLDQPADVKRYARCHVGLLTLLAVAVLAVGLLLLPRLPFYRNDPWVFLLYLAAVIPQIGMLDWVGLGLERMTWVGIAKVSRSLLYAALVFLLITRLESWSGWPARRWVPTLFLLSFLGSNTVMAVPISRWVGGFVWPAWGPRAEWRRRLALTAPIGGSIVVGRLLQNIDVVVLGVLAAPEVVGAYAAGAKVAFVLMIAVEVLGQALLPRLSRLWRESRAAFRTRLALYLGLLWAFFAPAAVGGVLLGERLMQFVYRGQFPAAGLAFRVLCAGYVLLGLGQLLGNALIASDRQRAVIPPILIASALAVGGNLWLVPGHGAAGACGAMLAAHAALFVITVWICRSLLDRRLVAPLVIVAVAAGVMGLAVHALAGWPLLLLVAVGALVYVAVAGLPLWLWVRTLRRSLDDAVGP